MFSAENIGKLIFLAELQRFDRRMAQILLSPNFLVLAADANIFAVLGYPPHEVIGRSILSFTGPRSDPHIIESAVLGMLAVGTQLILYGPCGNERHLIVSCYPYQISSISFGCRLTLHISEAITLEDSFAFIPSSRVPFASSETIDDIQMASKAVTTCFECNQNAVLGEPLYRFNGETYFSNPRNVPRCSAFHRVVRSKHAAAYSTVRDAEVEATLVSEAPNGRMLHPNITFGPPNRVGRVAVRVQHALEGLPRSPPMVLPRRKSGAHGAPASAEPVILTREFVARLSDLPLLEAAAAAGICPTAFKKACRKIGIRRWTYRRSRLASADKETAAAAARAASKRSGKEDTDKSDSLCEVEGGHAECPEQATPSAAWADHDRRSSLQAAVAALGLSTAEVAAAAALAGMAAATASVTVRS